MTSSRKTNVARRRGGRSARTAAAVGNLDAGELVRPRCVEHDRRFTLRFETNGKGWPGSIASGVSTGTHHAEIVCQESLACFRGVRLAQGADTVAASSGRSALQQAACRAASAAIGRGSPQLLRGRAAVGRALVDAGAVLPAASATRTMKNSSRLEAIARNLTRSSSGWVVVAWSSTRRLNPSQLSSRLM